MTEVTSTNGLLSRAATSSSDWEAKVSAFAMRNFLEMTVSALQPASQAEHSSHSSSHSVFTSNVATWQGLDLICITFLAAQWILSKHV